MRNGKVSTNPARLVRLRKENSARLRFLRVAEEATLRSKIRETYPEGEAESTNLRRGERQAPRPPNFKGLLVLEEGVEPTRPLQATRF